MTDLALRAQNRTPRQENSNAPGEQRRDERRGELLPLLGAASVGAAIALSLGLYGRFHTPTGVTIDPIRPRDLLAVKSTFATIAAALVVVQLATAFMMFRRSPSSGPRPGWLGPLHRWSGTVAFVATLPAAYHCLWSLGFQTTSTRVLIHSAVGCAFYGAFATKLLTLRSRSMPGWALPLVGATIVTLLVTIWFSSALWFFTGAL